MSESGGTKHDQEKIKFSLLSTLWLTGVGQVLNFGANKYAAHNWRKGIAISRLVDAALRHLLAFNAGEDNDPESGLSHLYHCSCCLMFMSELMITRSDLDDRFKILKEDVSIKGNQHWQPLQLKNCFICGQSTNTMYFNEGISMCGNCYKDGPKQ